VFLDNPAFKQLKLLLALLKRLDEQLNLLEEGIQTDNFFKVREVEKEVSKIKLEIDSYTGRELLLLEKQHFSKHCVDLIKKIKDHLTEEAFKEIYSTFSLPKSARLKQIKDLISKVLAAEKYIEDAKADYSYEQKMKNRARKIAVPQLSPYHRGFYHAVSMNRLSNHFSFGVHSTDSLQKMGYSFRGTANLQGREMISVHDPYSYWRLASYFEKIGKLSHLSELTEEDFMHAFKENSDLNFSKYAELNIKSVFGKLGDKEFSFFKVADPQHEGLLYSGFSSGFKSSFFPEKDYKLIFPTNHLAKWGDVVLVINDTAHLFPIHIELDRDEALFLGAISPKSITGIMSGLPFLEPTLEFAKFVGVPVYDYRGKLLWPLD